MSRKSDKENGKERRGVLSRQPSRAVIISALAAGGVFQLNGWQVQAHGNRSSHSATAVSSVVFTPDDYVLQKGNAPASLDFVRTGDADAAIAMIEGEGWTGRVLSEYNSALIAAGGQEVGGNGLIKLAKAAMAYSEKALKGLPGANLSKDERLVMEQVAEVYHNIASFTADAASADDLRLGREAAERALELRQMLRQKPEMMVAYQMAGKHYLRANQAAKAQDAFEAALKIATELNDPSGIAGSKSRLAQARSDAIRGK